MYASSVRRAAQQQGTKQVMRQQAGMNAQAIRNISGSVTAPTASKTMAHTKERMVMLDKIRKAHSTGPNQKRSMMTVADIAEKPDNFPWIGALTFSACMGGLMFHNLAHVHQFGGSSGAHNFEQGKTDGDTHVKSLRAAKKEAMPLTTYRGGMKKDMESHKRLRAEGAFDHRPLLGTEENRYTPLTMRYPGDHRLTQQLGYQRAEMGVRRATQVKTVAPQSFDDEKAKRNLKRTMTGIDGISSRYN